jgi:hypothetical protein
MTPSARGLWLFLTSIAEIQQLPKLHLPLPPEFHGAQYDIFRVLVVVKEFTLNRCPLPIGGQMMTPDRESCCGVVFRRDPQVQYDVE